MISTKIRSLSCVWYWYNLIESHHQMRTAWFHLPWRYFYVILLNVLFSCLFCLQTCLQCSLCFVAGCFPSSSLRYIGLHPCASHSQLLTTLLDLFWKPNSYRNSNQTICMTQKKGRLTKANSDQLLKGGLSKFMPISFTNALFAKDGVLNLKQPCRPYFQCRH